MSRIRLAAAFAWLSPIMLAPALAEEPLTTPPVLVTGGLTPIEAQSYGRSATIITAEEIETRNIHHVSEALRTVPGVSVSQTGGPGGMTTVRLRGAEGTHTLVLVDGIEISAPENGAYDFGGLLAADIERIEVLRGPQSALYGANAVGGVISIITKGAREPGLRFHAEGEIGTDLTGAGLFAMRGRNDTGSLSISLARRETEGFDISGTPGGEKDGDRNLTLNARGELTPTDWLTVGGTFRLVDRHSDTDGFKSATLGEPFLPAADLVYDDHSALDRQEILASLYAIGEHGRFRHEVRASYLTADDQTTNAGANQSDTTGTRFATSLRSTIGLDAPSLEQANHSLTLLAEYERETFKHNDPALTTFDPLQLKKQKRNLYGFAGEYRGKFLDTLDLQAGLRHEINDRFKNATTWSVGASGWATETTRVHSSVGRAVQKPTFVDQFGYFPGLYTGNPDLKPAESLGWDVGVEQAFWDDRVIVDVTYFQQRLKNKITENADWTSPINAPGISKRRGIEFSGTFRATDHLSFGAGYTWLDAIDPSGHTEIRRPKHEASANAEWRFLDRGTLRIDARYVAGNYDSDFRIYVPEGAPRRFVKLDNHLVVDVAASWAVTDEIEIFGRVKNAFDADYQELFGYETAGITGFAGIRARW